MHFDEIQGIPVGLMNAAPETDEPSYYRVSAQSDGAATVGPFGLTAQQIKNWVARASASDLDLLVGTRQLRSSTAVTIQSTQFDTVLSMIESGQNPPAGMIKRFIPGDLQRVIAIKLSENQ